MCSWCGKALDYCSAPDCQINYGSGCDGVFQPSASFGSSTDVVSRTKSLTALTHLLCLGRKWEMFCMGVPASMTVSRRGMLP